METDRNKTNQETGSQQRERQKQPSCKAMTCLQGSWNQQQPSPLTQLWPDPCPHHGHTMGTCQYSYPSLAQRPDHQPLPTTIGTVVQGWAAYWRGWASEFVVAIETWPHPTIKASSVRNPLLIPDTDLVLFGIMSSKKRKRTGLDKSWINSYDRCDFTLNYPVCKMFGEGQASVQRPRDWETTK